MHKAALNPSLVLSSHLGLVLSTEALDIVTLPQVKVDGEMQRLQIGGG